ncbi:MULTISPECIES: right-handed parallel beta-helix repeat-containing protein [Streptomyces]|uniref:Right-handed parallel beta-helix repeat-containing protein n=1 Tax=Streptomyces tsukubensis (strain DSM 42081 / NBRC 108919 / NRRL 18488 / 9993) TaxID=1114943 RepID=I2MZZ3_STRT9|nr:MULTISPECIES: right-handed parallel beta-helix repeat-containing protein [Streptomyces]AZK94579.1 stage V sporulation protein K [Streptomyces tsukubensis]EIF90340.1 hypothetical protein [Streptomyces tsukubensis NRRL18488]MYS67507.1 right-handed parallel beta-helix repeat-containing protein [Streptomyces sp. SID5473]QKM69334.1 right-handed parallel beta-helix repeat-containing protein [Streptomyces tsukubensis NRRL18488]TAI42734.1 right-handed parallel beta-helix repeat-containing protein [
MVARYVVSQRGGRRAHPTVSSALAAAARQRRPAVVEIAPGPYGEALTVRGDVQLVAAGAPGSVVVGTGHGIVLDAAGAVRVHGLTFTGRNADVVTCHAGTLLMEQCEVRAVDGVGVHARPGTSVILRSSTFRQGRVLFTGSGGLVERCRFADAADNAVGAIEGARIAVRDSWIGGSLIHGIRVSGARAEITGCELTRTGKAAVVADAQGELVVTGCSITSVQEEGVLFIEQSRGSVTDTRVVDAQHGIAVLGGADPLVRGCVFTECRDTGINVQGPGRGRFEECEVSGAGNVAVFSTLGGAPEVYGCRITGGKTGIAVTEAARGRFTRIRVRDTAGPALRVMGSSRAVFEDVETEDCPGGLETAGDGGTTAEVVGGTFRGSSFAAATAQGESWATLRNVSAHGGTVGFCAGDSAQLFLYDCAAEATDGGGVGVMDKARLVARNLRVNGSEGAGLVGRGSAHLDVVNAVFDDCAAAGAVFQDTCSARLAECSVTGERGVAVVHHGGIALDGLSTSLRIVERPPDALGGSPATVNNYHGPVFHAEAHGIQLAWQNGRVDQQQRNEGGSSS